MEEKDFSDSNVYAIPANYTDSGKLLSGMVAPRNAAETIILLLAIGKDRGSEPLSPVITSFGAFLSFRLDGLSTRLRLKNEKSLKICL